MYYINEGIFGSLVLYKEFQAMCPPKLVSSSSSVSDRLLTKATIWGPTCDSTDEVISDIFLPKLNIGDWLYFENMGAYTGVVHSPFNGFPKPQSLYYISKSDAAEMVCKLKLVSFCMSAQHSCQYNIIFLSLEMLLIQKFSQGCRFKLNQV